MTSRGSRQLRAADTKTRLDVETWPDLDKIRYRFRVQPRELEFGPFEESGEALTEPFLFGRAYDAPPFYAYSVYAPTFGEAGEQVWYDIAMIWEGQHLHGYTHIHPVPPRSAPTIVLLDDMFPPVPILTIGVSEWIQDEQLMYVGAILWVVAPVFLKIDIFG